MDLLNFSQQWFWYILQVNLIWSLGFLTIRFTTKRMTDKTAYGLLTIYHLLLLPVLFIGMLLQTKMSDQSYYFTLADLEIVNAAQSAPLLFYQQFIIVALIIFVSIAIVYFILNFVRLFRLAGENESELIDLLKSVTAELKLRKKISLIISIVFKDTFSFSLRHSYIVLPEHIVERCDQKELEYILRHEAIHIKRHDFWINFFQKLTNMCFIYNPLILWSNSLIDQKRELLVDHELLQSKAVSKKDYANILFKMSQEPHQDSVFSVKTPFTSNPKQLKERIDRMINPTKSEKKSKLFLAIITMLIVSLSIACSKTHQVEDSVAFHASEIKPKIMKRGIPVYPEAAKQQGVEGTVVIGIVIDETGKVHSKEILKSTNVMLNAAAMKAMGEYEFSPGKYDGKAVKVRWQIPFRFKLSG